MRSAVYLCLLLPALAQTPLPLPEWLAPFPQSRDLVAANGASSYTAMAKASAVTAHYQQELRAAGIAFDTNSDGLGVSIIATSEKITAVIRIRDDDAGSKVRVSYASKPEPAADASPGGVAAPSPGSSAAKTAPPRRTNYSWVMQSVRLPTNPVRYAAYYFEVSTFASIEKPLPLPAGGYIIDVFPDDCAFQMSDRAGHSLTFHNRDEARNRRLDPGTWSLIPLKCSGIDVFLR